MTRLLNLLLQATQPQEFLSIVDMNTQYFFIFRGDVTPGCYFVRDRYLIIMHTLEYRLIVCNGITMYGQIFSIYMSFNYAVSNKVCSEKGYIFEKISTLCNTIIWYFSVILHRVKARNNQHPQVCLHLEVEPTGQLNWCNFSSTKFQSVCTMFFYIIRTSPQANRSLF